MEYWVDGVRPDCAFGWAYSKKAQKVVVEVWHGSALIGTSETRFPRPDIRAHFQTDSSLHSGFFVEFSKSLDLEPGRHDLGFVFKSKGGMPWITDKEECETFYLSPGSKIMAPARPVRPTPFPISVMHFLRATWPDQFTSVDFSDDAVQRDVVERLSWLIARGDPTKCEGLIAYFRFLRTCWSHFTFVEERFPKFNEIGKYGDKDFLARQNSKNEMLSIAHHLYCLCSYDLSGDLAEFGCFKGYSSSMLSFACSLLGTRMHIFDSFSGLPPSDSTYYRAGDFSGSLEEVQGNLALFGSPECVTMHPGYFKDTLGLAVPLLKCLWMDVDLAASAADVMRALPSLIPEGPVFSHECAPENFKDGIVFQRHADSVVPPIADGFRALGSDVAGRFLYGNTGAFWRPGVGFPVLSNEVLMQLIKLV